jgi:hypothetical protein
MVKSEKRLLRRVIKEKNGNQSDWLSEIFVRQVQKTLYIYIEDSTGTRLGNVILGI